MWRRRFGRGYRWVGKTFGWSTIVYLVLWMGVFVVGGVQSSSPVSSPIPLRLLAPVCLAVAAVVLGTVVLQRLPPIILNRAQSLLQGLAPWPAARVLRPRMVSLYVSRGIVGAVVGTAAWLLVRILFAVNAPMLVALGAALWFLRATLAVLLDQRGGLARVVVVVVPSLAAAAAAFTYLGPPQGLGAVTAASVALAAVGLAVAGVTLARAGDAYRPGYLYDTMVASEMRAALLFTLLTQSAAGPRRAMQALAGGRSKRKAPSGRGRRRGSARLRLPAPDPRWGPLGAVAWRSALQLLRASPIMQLALLAALAYVYATLSAGVTGGLALAVLGLAAGFLASWLLGPGFEGIAAPLDSVSRGVGRSAPGVVLAAALFGVIALVQVIAGADPSGPTDAASLATGLVALATVTLEKASSWLHVSHRNASTWALSGLISGTLLWVLSAIGGPGTTAFGAMGIALFAAFLLP